MSKSKNRKTISGGQRARLERKERALKEKRARYERRFYAGARLRIIALRRAMKLTVPEFAAKIGMRARDYRKYENGERGPRGYSHLLIKLGEITNVYPAWLLCGATPKGWKGRARKAISADNKPLRFGKPCYTIEVTDDLMAPTLYPGDHAIIDPNELPEPYQIGLVIPAIAGAKSFFARLDHHGKNYVADDQGKNGFGEDLPEHFAYQTLDGHVWNHPTKDIKAIHRVDGYYRAEANACDTGEIYTNHCGHDIRRTASFETLKRVVSAVRSRSYLHGAKISRSGAGEPFIQFKVGGWVTAAWKAPAMPLTEAEADELAKMGATDERQASPMLAIAAE